MYLPGREGRVKKENWWLLELVSRKSEYQQYLPSSIRVELFGYQLLVVEEINGEFFHACFLLYGLSFIREGLHALSVHHFPGSS